MGAKSKNRTTAFVGDEDKIEQVISEIYEQSELCYLIISLVYRYGLSQVDALSMILVGNEEGYSYIPSDYLAINNHFPSDTVFKTYSQTCNRIGGMNCSLLPSVDTIRQKVFGYLKVYGKEYGLCDLNIRCLRKTWAFHVLAHGGENSFSVVKKALSYKGDVGSFLKYLGVPEKVLMGYDNLRGLYIKSLMSKLEKLLLSEKADPSIIAYVEKITRLEEIK